MYTEVEALDISQYGRRPASDLAFLALRRAILTGQIPQGTRLLANEIAERMGMSRTPVREALQKLELEGLVDNTPWRGAVVASHDLEDIEEFYEIRGALEGVIAYLAARRGPRQQLARLEEILEQMEETVATRNIPEFLRLQEDYYEVYVDLGQSRRLKQMVSSIRDQVHVNKWISVRAPGRLQSAFAGLKAVAAAIGQGDANAAAARAIEHCRNAFEAFKTGADASNAGAAGRTEKTQ